MAMRRQMKNVVKNFTDIEVKVRESTSNDPWGPSSSLTSEIADATYNVQAFSEIMTLLWKRINDHGKNWRHVYKSLVVLDYIVKTGSERVAQQCRENIFAIKTLKDFQFIDKDGKDQGVNVREKSKQLVALLKDDERLKSERMRALKAKERFSQSQGGIGNTSFPKNKKFQGSLKYTESKGSVDDSNLPSQSFEEPERAADSHSTDGRIASEMEKVRPSNEVEEEMQLQIALAMSREEAEQDERIKQPDSQFLPVNNQQQPSTLLNLSDPISPPQQSSSALYDPWMQQNQPTQLMTQAPPVQPVADPWGGPTQLPSQPMARNIGVNQTAAVDPWGGSEKPSDPWGAPTSVPTSQPDPWGTASSQPVPMIDPFALQNPAANTLHNDPFSSIPADPGLSLFDNNISPGIQNMSISDKSNGPSFLSNGAHLVDVDNILAPKSNQESVRVANPFMTTQCNTNPFLQDKPKPKSINEIRSDKSTFADVGPGGDTLLPTPIAPTNNPFL